LNVKAIDKSTNKEQSIRIEASSGLSSDEIERMKKEAEEHADEDAKKKELIESRNIADQMIYTAEKALNEHGDKVDEATKTTINEKIAKVREVKEKDDKASIDTATQELSTALQKIGEIMQKAAQENAGTTDNPVRDAEVTKEEPKKDEGQ
jgi:molecular chaperone DnaK